MSDESDFEVDVRRGRIRGVMPGAIVTAVVTALSTGAVSRCATPEPAADMRRELGEIKMTQAQILEKLNRVDEDARNRDVVQNAAIESLRNR